MKKAFSKKYIIKILTSIIGIAITCFSASLFYKINMGADPYQVFAIAVHKRLGISYGQANLLLNSIIVILLVIFKRKYINVSLFLSLFIAGPLLDFFNHLIGPFIGTDLSLWLKLILAFTGTIFLSFGVYLYISPQLGASPADSVGLIISDMTRIPYKRIRILTDALYTVIGLSLGGFVGIVTVLSVVLTGPCIGWLQDRLNKRRVIKYISC
ncbi:YczE/YyaS/YitT family protein [Bacillus sp. FJAT-28004]|uniref:YczE/YyaS/YitT family protein n=1 Tax=Bacillus sp. FJAT-28004 TaxID=1679165 RepID=UPI0006B5B91E|nr:membrane protein [Bacillus sp. FJAT-28004]